MAFDAKQFSQKEWAILIAGGVAFISLFLPWYGASYGGVIDTSVNGWSTGYGWIGAALLVAAAVYLVLTRLRGEDTVPKLSARPARIVLSLSAVGLVLVLIRLGSLPHGSGNLGGVVTYQYGARAGLVIALIAGIVQVLYAGLIFRSARGGRSRQPKAGGAPTTT
jgi:hypothetical protein